MAGRHRDPHLDPAIAAASARLVRAEGYWGFSIERVAKDLGIPRSTVYARWSGRGELLDALLAELLAAGPVREGTLREVLKRLLQEDVACARCPEGRAAAQLLLAAQDPEGPPADRVRASLRARRQRYLDLFERHGVDPAAAAPVVDIVLGSVWGASVLQDGSTPDHLAGLILSLVNA